MPHVNDFLGQDDTAVAHESDQIANNSVFLPAVIPSGSIWLVMKHPRWCTRVCFCMERDCTSRRSFHISYAEILPATSFNGEDLLIL